MKKQIPWTHEEEQRLRDLWGSGHTTGEISKLLGCSRPRVSGRINRLGLFGGRALPRTPWSREEIDFLIDHYRKPGWTAQAIAARLDRPVGSVYDKARYFGCAKPGEDYKTKPTEIDQRIVTLAMANTSSSEIAERVGCSAGYVWKVMRARPGLHKRWKEGEGDRRSRAVARAHAEGRHPGPGWREPA